MIGPQSHILNYTRSAAATAPAITRRRVLAPLAALGFLELALLTVYVEFTAPGLSRIAVPAISVLFGSESLHYPQHMWYLPAVLDWIRFAAAVVAGAACYRATVYRLVAHLGEADRPARSDGGAVGAIFLAVAAYALVDLLLQRGVGLLAEVRIVGRLQPLWIFCVLIARAVLAIATAHTVYGIVAAGRRGRGAIRSGMIVTWRSLPFTLLVAVTATVITGPVDLLVDRAAWFVDLDHPEGVGMLAGLAVLIDIPIRAWLFASAVWLRMTRGLAR